MNDQPLITIAITCYNAADTIQRAIESAVAQGWPNKEILIVDDCSSDNSVEVVKNLIKDIPYASLVCHKENHGTGQARQTLIDNAKGDFVAFFDDDDVSFPERISTQYKTIIDYEENNSIDMLACYASGERKYPNGYTFMIDAIGSNGCPPKGEELASYLLYNNRKEGVFYGSGTPTCSLMARRKTFLSVGGFDKKFRRLQDADFAIRLSLAGGHFIGTSDRIFVQYSTGGIDKSPERKRDAAQGLAEKYKDFLDKNGMYYYAYHWPLLRYYHFKNNHLMMLFVLLKILSKYPCRVLSHFIKSATKRFFHEKKMNRKKRVE